MQVGARQCPIHQVKGVKGVQQSQNQVEETSKAENCLKIERHEPAGLAPNLYNAKNAHRSRYPTTSCAMITHLEGTKRGCSLLLDLRSGAKAKQELQS